MQVDTIPPTGTHGIPEQVIQLSNGAEVHIINNNGPDNSTLQVGITKVGGCDRKAYFGMAPEALDEAAALFTNLARVLRGQPQE